MAPPRWWTPPATSKPTTPGDAYLVVRRLAADKSQAEQERASRPVAAVGRRHLRQTSGALDCPSGPAGQGTLPVANLPTGTYSCTIVITDLANADLTVDADIHAEAVGRGSP